MTLHPDAQAVLEFRRAEDGPGPDASVQELRAADLKATLINGESASDVVVTHSYIAGPTADLPLMVITPERFIEGSGALVYFHGGGWVFNQHTKYQPMLTQMASESGLRVIAVNYQKAPEHTFPIPFDDCYATLEWVLAHADALGIDPAKVGVGGDSAGGNLAAAVALKAADSGIALAFQMLIYPCVDTDYENDSYQTHAVGYGLERAGMKACWDAYVPVEHFNNKYAVPMRAESFVGVAPAVVALAEHDCFRDEGVAYAQRLSDDGIQVSLKEYPGMIHGFFGHGSIVADAYELRKWLSAEITKLTK
jgi:acetyl esterase